MDQPEEILEKLERFNVQKNSEISRELEEYITFVARTGESVFNWTLVKKLYREKLINVITEFYNETPTKELPQYPNVDPFNYETMKKMLIEKLDSFSAAPFTIQRISELLSDPRKQYSRIDKFMRAVEKNILVVSTISPGRNRSEESENGDSLDSVGLNGDFSSDVNVDIDMENDGSFTMTKEFNATTIRKEPTHDVMTETQETVTIKKVASQEEEASTSTVAVNVSNGEQLSTTQTDMKIETQSTVTITVVEDNSKQPVSREEENIEKVSDENAEQIQKAEDTVIKSDIQHEPITLLAESVEPKIDDALLNEPLRPVDDEILPENPETTPLAALENIVANRVEVVVTEQPRIEEQLLQKQKDEITEESKIQETNTAAAEDENIVTKEEPIEQNAEENQTISETDDSGIEAKRIKIEEIETLPPKVEATEVTDIPAEIPIKSENPVDNVAAPVIEEPQEIDQPIESDNLQEELKQEEEITEAVSESVQATPIIEEPQIFDPIIKAKEMEDIPVATEPIVETDNIIAEPIVEQPAAIEPVSENTMTLDEEPPTAQIADIPQEMAEPVPPMDKMDTDDNETENVQMDTDETMDTDDQ